MDNGELKQCGICGKVYACSGYSILLEDRSEVLRPLKYEICPVCYARILRGIVVIEQEGKVEGDICRGEEALPTYDERDLPPEGSDCHGEVGWHRHIAS